MGDESWAFGTLNAKRMTPTEVARAFVMPDIFQEISGLDHCYVVGPRGSGKTTLLRMLHGESLAAWQGRVAEQQRSRITYSGIFLPADELWASQTNPQTARAAFALQMLLSFLDCVEYRTGRRSSSGTDVHLGVTLDGKGETEFVRECAEGWGVSPSSNTVLGLQAALDLALLRLGSSTRPNSGHLGAVGTLELLRFGVRAFNRAVGQSQHRWAVLLDELELAPPEIHNEVQRFIRGGSGELILKVSISPFDPYMHSFIASGGAPSPANDFRAVYLSGQSRQDIRRFTEGLWKETLRQNGYTQVSMRRAFDNASADRASGDLETSFEQDQREMLVRTRDADPDFAAWLTARAVDPDNLDRLTYNQRSATVRKVYPLLVFRDALISFRKERPVRRSRKKSVEPFTGASAIAAALEGNPRWIKSAFSDMVRSYDPATESVSIGFQLDALKGVANRFDALLHVLPRTEGLAPTVSVPALVDTIATYFNEQHLGPFNPEPPNSFKVDDNLSQPLIDALALALYAGAIVHLRGHRSSAVLSDFQGQRFRLSYVLGVRDGKEFPLRLGRDVSLSRIVKHRDLRTGGRLPVESIPAKARSPLQEEFSF